MELGTLRINEERFRADFEEFSRIGATGDTGVNRPAFSEAHLAARSWLRKKIEAAGLAFRVDGAGNHSAFLGCGPQGAPSLGMGSHIDSVPTGGRYDGALGVLAALEVLRTVQESGLRLPLNLEGFDFTDEEGALVSFLGSYAFCGLLTAVELENPRSSRQALRDGLHRAGLSPESVLSARREPGTLAGYLELHVEQGPRLEQSGTPIGVVTRISGLSFYRMTYLGRPDHAGSTAMDRRLDASLGASAFTLGLHSLVLERFPECFANVGSAAFEPGAFNIVPARVTLAVEFRAVEDPRLQELKEAVLQLAEQEARRFGLGLEVEMVGERAPVELSPAARAAVAGAAQALGLRAVEMISYAGHDAQPVAGMCPTGMIFVPSAGGISHSPDEFTAWQDCVNGANVLLQSALRLAAVLPDYVDLPGK